MQTVDGRRRGQNWGRNAWVAFWKRGDIPLVCFSCDPFILLLGIHPEEINLDVDKDSHT